MKKIGKERTAGFSLLEVAVAIAIIGLISAPICTSLILAGRINAHSQAVMEAHLNVRTAVETLMKNGVMASLSDVIDFDTASIIAEELGCKVEKEEIGRAHV